MPDIDQDDRVLTDEQIERLRARYGWPLPPMCGGAPDDDEADNGSGDDGDSDDGESQNADDASTGTDDDESTDDGDDDFDRDRALRTIKKQREAESALKKELRALRDQVRQFKDANKSEEERRNERLSTAERTAASATAEAARLRVALRKGLTETQAKRLVGETEEELEADADDLLESFGAKRGDGAKDDGKSRRQEKRLKPGAAPDAEPDEETDPAKLAANLPSYA